MKTVPEADNSYDENDTLDFSFLREDIENTSGISYTDDKWIELCTKIAAEFDDQIFNKICEYAINEFMK